MKISLSLIAVAVSLASGFAPAFGAPESKPKPSQKAPAKPVADPLDIPAFAPIPNEFVFAGTQKDVYKLLARYTGGVSLDKLPEPTEKDRQEIAEKKGAEGNATLQALLDLRDLLAPIHVIRVRSVSYYALDEEAQHKAYEELAPKKESAPKPGIPGDMNSGVTGLTDNAYNRGYERSQELLKDAETFYKNLLAKQGGKIQMQLRGETSITVYAIAEPQTFAVVTRGPSRVIVARADGKPDVGAITSIFQRVVGDG